MTSESVLTNAFPITFESETCPYSTWTIVGLDEEDQAFEQNRIALRRLVSRDVGGPAEIERGDDGRVMVYVPDGCGEPAETYDLVPRVASLRPAAPGVLRVTDDDATSRRLATRFLQSAVSAPLWGDRGLWQPQAGRAFYDKKPANGHDDRRSIDVFEGHNVRVDHIAGVGFVVFISETVRYAQTDPWPEHIAPSDRKAFLKGQSRGHGKPRCVYHYGDQWYEVSVQSVLPDSVADIQFVNADGERVTVYDHTRDRWRSDLPEWSGRLDPQATAISYVTWAGSERKNGFAHLCHRIVTTHEMQAMGQSRLHRDHAIRDPDVRLHGAKAFARRLGPLTIGDVRGSVELEPAAVPSKVFPVPDLEFGGGYVLHTPSDKVAQYPQERLALLKRRGVGLWQTGSLGEQWVLVPQSIKRTLWPPFLGALQREVRTFSDGALRYDPTVIWYDNPGRGLARQVRAVQSALNQRNGRPSGYCLAVLPQQAHPQLAATLTSDLSAPPSLHVACIHQDSFSRFFERERAPRSGGGDLWALRKDRRAASRAKGYLRNVALKVLLLNNKWPFVLAEGGSSASETLYIGLDVLDGTAGFTFMARGGRTCFFRSSVAARPEKLSSRQVYGVLSVALDDVRSLLGGLPDRVVLLRDGRMFPGEVRGFQEVMRDAGVRVAAAIALPKRSAAGHRLFAIREGGGRLSVQNPMIGTWLGLSEDEALLSTTGRPFKLPGTAKPLLIKRVAGDEPVEALAEDVFALAQLAWTAPDRCIRDPFVLRYTDQMLRAVGGEVDHEELAYGEAPVA
ncbi:hypothetical protein RQM47_16595 [Rubrivirga sp. S365]|uniref:hypothetical protein n=1 Tax=Rubrivirga sp. S365 TaxID=3076080 RepID=UPI0028CA93D4|nr:hypothetical protein [Rubrivirga sp. S365]MDT7858270.1 hypothetical protein [Rubrivirga sp. S365]